MKSVTLVNAPAGKRTRADLGHTFRYVLNVSSINNSTIDVYALCGSKKREVSVPVHVPEFSVTPDAFAGKVMLKVNGSDADMTTLLSNLRIWNGSNEVTAGNITRDAQTGIITVVGLNSNTKYSNFKVRLGQIEKAVAEFTTEPETDIPNGNLSAVTQTVNFTGVQIGGGFSGVAWKSSSYKHSINIVRSEANGWASLNALTAYANSSNKNTWYMVPSTFVEGGVATVRTVGYSHSGKDFEGTGGTAVYYSKQSPAEGDLSKANGEMFLGSYSFTGSANRVDGIAWATRPSTLSFDYKFAHPNYTKDNGTVVTSSTSEKGVATVKVLDASGNVLASQEVLLDPTDQMTTKTVNLAGYPFGVKAAKIIVGFKSSNSSNPVLAIPTGEDLHYSGGMQSYNLCDGWLVYGAKSANDYKAYARGCELTVDNVKLGYGQSANALRAAKARKAKTNRR